MKGCLPDCRGRIFLKTDDARERGECGTCPPLPLPRSDIEDRRLQGGGREEQREYYTSHQRKGGEGKGGGDRDEDR